MDISNVLEELEKGNQILCHFKEPQKTKDKKSSG